MAMTEQAAIASFREIYVILQVTFARAASYDDVELQKKMTQYLGEAYDIVPDDQKPSEGSWGFRRSEPSIIFGYNPAAEDSEGRSSIVSIARMSSEDYKASLSSMQQNMQEGALGAGKGILKEVSIDSLEIELVLYYDPFINEEDDTNRKMLKKLAAQLVPLRSGDNASMSFERFSVDYTTAYKNDFTRSIGYSFAKNVQTKRESLQVSISITNNDIEGVGDVAKALSNIDVIGEITEEAEYLGARKKAAE